MSQKLPEPGASNSPPKGKPYWVYVIQSQQVRVGKRGNPLPGFHYVGMTTDPKRRLRQHNGEIKGGGKWTAKHRPHAMRAIYGPYADRSTALKAERALKRSKRGVNRCRWSPEDTYKGVSWCRGLGVEDPRVAEINAGSMAILNHGHGDTHVPPTFIPPCGFPVSGRGPL